MMKLKKKERYLEKDVNAMTSSADEYAEKAEKNPPTYLDSKVKQLTYVNQRENHRTEGCWGAAGWKTASAKEFLTASSWHHV